MTASTPIIDRAVELVLVVVRLVVDRMGLRRVMPAKEPRSGCQPLATAEAKDISSSSGIPLLMLLLLLFNWDHRCDDAADVDVAVVR